MSLLFSSLAKKRLSYKPKLSAVLKNLKHITAEKASTVAFKIRVDRKVKPYFKKSASQPLFFLKTKSSGIKTKTGFVKPLKVGVVFSGGQASGGHNVIAGVFDSLKKIHAKSELIGFLGGPSGIIDNKYKKITAKELSFYRNQGGFDLIGSGRTKIETKDQLKAALKSAEKLGLDGLVIIGGDDSNTNAAVLAEYFLKAKIKTRVIGVPKTIDGDLRGEHIEHSFGFDTATKTYSEMIGNIAKDALSAKKYYHFIKLMGRSASHVTLECALNTQINFVFIAEEVLAQKLSLAQLADDLYLKIKKRSLKGKNYGVVLIPEGLIEFVPEVKELIKELNSFLSSKKAQLLEKVDDFQEKVALVLKNLSSKSSQCFSILPDLIKKQLLLDRDPHGNVQVSAIETEKLLIELVQEKLKKDKKSKIKFKAQPHFLGYEGRSGLPSNFDANYCYNLGFVASILISKQLTGYMAALKGLSKDPRHWQPMGVPLVSMMRMEVRKGQKKPVIQKNLVDLQGRDFKKLKLYRKKLEEKDLYLCPGPIQF